MRSGARSSGTSGASGARGMGGVRNSNADGRWHSFGVGRSGFAGSRFGRGIGANGFAGRGFGRGVFGGRGVVGRGFGSRFGGVGRGYDRFGHGFGHGFGGCWDCGFGGGWGWGLGLGWPYWGFDWSWPYWDWGFGWGGPGYWGFGWGYPGWNYPYWNGYLGLAPYPYTFNDYDDAWEWDNSNAGDYGDYTGDTTSGYSDNYSADSVYSNAADDGAGVSQAETEANSSNSTGVIDPESIPTVVYLKDGTSFQITSYWSSGNTLHYVDSQGGVSTIDASQIDLQRTASENAKRGIRFPIKSEPAQPSTQTQSTTRPSAPAVHATSFSKSA